MSSKSKSSQKTSYSTHSETHDKRNVADNGGLAVSGDGVVVNMVADEAFELGHDMMDAHAEMYEGLLSTSTKVLQQSADTNQILANQLSETREAAANDATELGTQLIRIGIPAAAIAFVASRVL